MASKVLKFHNSQSLSLKVFKALFPEQVLEGNKIADFTGQTGEVGMPISFGYGKYPTQGNVIWCSPVTEHVKKKKQGKGGTTTKEYSYTVSYAIAVSVGPIYAFEQIKRNGKLVYSESDNYSPQEIAFFGKWINRGGLYYGTEEQLPDPTIESYKGVGNVSAFRGLAYIVYKDDDVTDTAGAIPQYQFVIQGSPPEVYCTSRPYPNDMAVEGLGMSAELRAMNLKKLLVEQPFESVGMISELRSIDQRTILKNYSNYPPEGVGVTSTLQSIDQRTILKNYSNALPEQFGLSPSLQSISQKVILQIYSNEPPNQFGLTASLQSISLGP